jgi:membrane protein YqaA with SNARE-associated domain
MISNIIAFFWGFAEATLFFIVPDVALSVISLNSINDGLIACLYAVGGAMTGGAVIYYWGRNNIEKVTRIFLRIPAIRPKDIDKVHAELKKMGIAAVLFGPLLGIPYKIYAAYAHLFSSSFYFLLITIPARIVRFILVTLITPHIINWLFPSASHEVQVRGILLIWAILYTIYFIIKRK